MNNPQQFDFMRAQYARNLTGLQQMLARAQRTRRKVGGYTATELAERVASFSQFAVLDDAGMASHLMACRQRVSARLAELRG